MDRGVALDHNSVMTTTLPLAEVKARLSAVLDGLRSTHDRVVITRNGRPEAVFLSVDDLEALEETLDVLSTPGLSARLDQAAQEIDDGHFVTDDQLRVRYRSPNGA